MSQETVFTVQLEPELHTEFMAAAASENRPVSQVIRELMRAYIANTQQTRYHTWLTDKVEAGRKDMHAGRSRSSEAVEAAFAQKRAQALMQRQ